MLRRSRFGVELHEVDPVHALGVDLFAGLKELFGCGLQMRAVFRVVPRSSLDRGRHVGPEGRGIEQANVVGGLEEVVEHEVAEPEPPERSHYVVGCIEERHGFPRLPEFREQVLDRLGAVGGGVEGNRGGVEHAIAPVVGLEQMRSARRAVDEAGCRCVVVVRGGRLRRLRLRRRARPGARARRSRSTTPRPHPPPVAAGTRSAFATR